LALLNEMQRVILESKTLLYIMGHSDIRVTPNTHTHEKI
jgi:hypothetical protein